MKTSKLIAYTTLVLLFISSASFACVKRSYTAEKAFITLTGGIKIASSELKATRRIERCGLFAKLRAKNAAGKAAVHSLANKWVKVLKAGDMHKYFGDFCRVYGSGTWRAHTVQTEAWPSINTFYETQRNVEGTAKCFSYTPPPFNNNPTPDPTPSCPKGAPCVPH